MGSYVWFAAINVGIGAVGWLLWNDISTWFNQGYSQIAVCLGCRRHAIVPGCPLHDPERRLEGEAVSPDGRAEAS